MGVGTGCAYAGVTYCVGIVDVHKVGVYPTAGVLTAATFLGTRWPLMRFVNCCCVDTHAT